MSLDIALVAYLDLGGKEKRRVPLHSQNCTHNVTDMWRKAGVYDALYNSDGTIAKQWLPTLWDGAQDMATKRDEYVKLNPMNQWGDFDGALRFLRQWIRVCEEMPLAIIEVSK